MRYPCVIHIIRNILMHCRSEWLLIQVLYTHMGPVNAYKHTRMIKYKLSDFPSKQLLE